VTSRNSPILSVVAAMFDEQECVEQFVKRTVKAVEPLGISFELILVDDGSCDHTLKIATGLVKQYPCLRVVALSRNFGHEKASSAGLRYAAGEAVVLMDSDLEHPPEVIPKMWKLWKQGYQIVFGKRRLREKEGCFKKLMNRFYYWGMRKTTGLNIPAFAVDFRLMDRKVVEAFNCLPERNRLVRALTSWTGFRSIAFDFKCGRRYGGRSKYNFSKLALIAMDTLIAFTSIPLRVATFAGAFLVISSIGWGIFIALQHVFDPSQPGAGATALLAGLVVFLGGFQLCILGVVGEYLFKVYEEVQQRPLYIVQDLIGFGDSEVTQGAEGHRRLRNHMKSEMS